MPPIKSNEPRKIAPVVRVGAPHIDDRRALVEKVKKEMGKKADGMHFFYGDANIAKTGRYKDDGYIETGKDHKGDPLFYRPESMHKQHLAEAADVSVSTKLDVAAGRGDKYQTRTSDGDVVGPQEE